MAAAAPQVQARPAGGQLNWPLALAAFDANSKTSAGSGAAAAITFSADTLRPIVLRQIFCGYDGTPQAGATIKVEDGSGTTVWQMPITAAGPFVFTFDPPKTGTKNTAMIITLSAGGGSVTAYLAATAYVEA